jgi:AhpC/TSA family
MRRLSEVATLVVPLIGPAAADPTRSAGNRTDTSLRRSVWANLVLLIVTLAAVASEGSGQGQPATPAEQYKALRKEYDMATGSGVPLSDAERLKFVGRVYKHHYAVAEKFLKLAEKYPNDPVALDCLIQAVWQVNGTPWPVELVGEDTARAKAFELIRRDHLQSDKLGPLCQRVAYGFCKEYETFLRELLAKSPHQEIQATACLSLGRFLNNRLQRLDLCKDQPELAREFAGLYGKEYLADLLRQDRAKALRDLEAVFEQAAEKFAGVKLPDCDTVAERANAELFAIRNLSVGREAPDIEGQDQDGKRFKLSDYRGKVVLLDFWSYV